MPVSLRDALYGEPVAAQPSPLSEALAAPQAPLPVVQQGALPAGLASGLRSNKAMLKAYGASALDAMGDSEAAARMYDEALQNSAEAQAMAPEVRDYRQVNSLGDAAQFVAGHAGSGVASTLPALGLTLATRGLGGGRALSYGAGMAGMQPLEAGETALTLREDPEAMARTTPGERFAISTGKGLVNAAGEEVVPYFMANKLFTRAPVRSLRQAVKSAGTTVGKGLLGEGVTETGQELVGQQAHALANPARSTLEDKHSLINAALAGASAGGGMSLPSATLGTALDAAYSAKGAAAAGAQPAQDAGRQLLDAAVDSYKQARTAAPGTLDEAAQAAGRGAAAVKETAADLIDRALIKNADPRLDALLKPQNGMDVAALRQDDAAKHAAASELAAQVQAAVDQVPQSVRDAADRYTNGPRTMNSWAEFSEVLRSWERSKKVKEGFNDIIEAVHDKGEAAYEAATGAYKKARRSNAQDDAFSRLFSDALFRHTGVGSSDQIIAELAGVVPAVRGWVESWKQGEEPVVSKRLYAGLVKSFGDPVAAVNDAYALLRRQGLVEADDAHKAVIAQLRAQQQAEGDVEVLVNEALLPTAIEQHGIKTSADVKRLTGALLELVRKGKLKAAGKLSRLDELFGPRKEEVLAALRAHLPSQHHPLEEPEEERGGARLSDEERDAVEDTGEAVAATDAVHPGELGESVRWHFYAKEVKPEYGKDEQGDTVLIKEGRPERPYHTLGKVENVDKETGEISEVGTHEQHAENKSGELRTKNKSDVRRVGYADYLREIYASQPDRLVDSLLKFIQDHQHELSADERSRPEKHLNRRYFVLRESAAGDAYGAIDIPASEFRVLTPDAKTNVWAESPGKGNENATVAKGRIWLERADGKQFVTSTAKIIKRMSAAGKQGEDLTEITGEEGLARQYKLLMAGLSSLLSAKDAMGNYALTGRVGFLMKPGSIKDVNWKLKTLPDELHMFAKRDNEKATLGGAKAAIEHEQKTVLMRSLKSFLDSERGSSELLEQVSSALKSKDIKTMHEVQSRIDARYPQEGIWSPSRTGTERAPFSWLPPRSGTERARKDEIDRLRYAPGSTVVDPSAIRTRRSTNYTTRNEILELLPVNETAGPIGQQKEEHGQRQEMIELTKKEQAGKPPKYELKAKPLKPRGEHHGISEGDEKAEQEYQDSLNEPFKRDEHGMEVQSEGSGRLLTGNKDVRPGPVEVTKLERRANAQSTKDELKAAIASGDKEAMTRLTKQAQLERPTKIEPKQPKAGEPGSKENPHVVPMYYRMAPDEVRKELRAKYPKGTTTAQLIQDGARTGTTRTPQRGVMPGHYIRFQEVVGIYRVVNFERVDLESAEGREKWSKREGWDTAAAMKKFPSQVRHGAIQMVFERAEGVVTPINVYYGAGENAHLSNLARRPFTGEDGREYRSVEHAYQTWKSGKFEAEAYERGKTRAKAGGTLGTKSEGGWNFKLMEKLIRRSFAHNPDAAKKLLETGDAPITHAQDRGVWQTKFPELLMKIRDELRAETKPAEPSAQKVILPRTSSYTAKDQAKSDKANKFIGRGSPASSTAAYAKTWGDRANTGQYEASDRVFLSAEGMRTGRKVLDTAELQKAMDAGATIITDDAANRGRSYNIGEREAAAYLSAHGYEETTPGEWKPSTQKPRRANAMSTINRDKRVTELKKIFESAPKNYGEIMPAVSVDDVLSTLPKKEKTDPDVRRLVELMIRNARAEKISSPLFWTDEERKAQEYGSAEEFSKLRGYTDKEIADFNEEGRLIYALSGKYGGFFDEEKTVPDTDWAMDISWKVQSRLHAGTSYQHWNGLLVEAINLFDRSHGRLDAYDLFNRQTAFGAIDAEPLSEAEQTRIRAEVVKRLGPDVRTAFEKSLGGLSGDWTEGFIRVALGAVNPGQVAAHESMHEFFGRLVKDTSEKSKHVREVLLRAASNKLILRQLELRLIDHPAALEQIKDGAEHAQEERLAYMFQFWQGDPTFNIGPQTESTFKKILAFLRKVVGLLSDEQKAERLFEAFEAGKLQTADAAIEYLHGKVEWREQQIKAAAAAMRPVAERVDRALGSVGERLHRSKNPHIAAVGRKLKTPTGEGGEEAYVAAKDRQFKLWSNKLLNIFEGYTPEELKVAAKYLHSDKRSNDARINTLVDRLKGNEKAGIKGLLPEFEVYAREAGVEFGHIKNYFPRAYDVTKILEKSDEFIARLLKRHKGELMAVRDKARKEVEEKKSHGELSASETHAIDTLFGRIKEGQELSVEDVATAITARIINSYGQIEVKEDFASVGYSPYMRAVNQRTLEWLDTAEFADFMQEDVSDIMTTYLAQGTKRAEYVRRFGNGGERLKHELVLARDWEVDQEVEKKYGVKDASKKARDAMQKSMKGGNFTTAFEQELAFIGAMGEQEAAKMVDEATLKLRGTAKDIMALEGTLGYDINPKLRRIENSMMVYENLRTMGLSLFSQFIDPLGILIRGGELNDAWEAYKRGLKEVWASWKGEKLSDEQRRIAELVGTVDAHAMLSTFGQTYSSLFMGGRFRKANDMLFKWNGMEGFNQGMQIGATTAAIGFIKRHVQSPTKNSAAYLEELQLKPEDVKVDAEGHLDYTDPKIQRAIYRWVNGAIIRPNAAQRPAWASDPHWMIFWHMKQFAYSFHDVILRRVKHDALRYGEVGPAATLALGYVPVMIAADAAKALLLTGQEPGWMRGGLDNMIEHGVMRAGLLGAPQALIEPLVSPRSVLSIAGPSVEHLSTIFEANPLPGASVMNAVGGYKN